MQRGTWKVLFKLFCSKKKPSKNCLGPHNICQASVSQLVLVLGERGDFLYWPPRVVLTGCKPQAVFWQMFEWSAYSHGEESFMSCVLVPSFLSVRKHCSVLQQLTNPDFPDNWKQTPTWKTPIQTKQQKKSNWKAKTTSCVSTLS